MVARQAGPAGRRDVGRAGVLSGPGGRHRVRPAVLCATHGVAERPDRRGARCLPRDPHLVGLRRQVGGNGLRRLTVGTRCDRCRLPPLWPRPHSPFAVSVRLRHHRQRTRWPSDEPGALAHRRVRSIVPAWPGRSRSACIGLCTARGAGRPETQRGVARRCRYAGARPLGIAGDRPDLRVQRRNLGHYGHRRRGGNRRRDACRTVRESDACAAHPAMAARRRRRGGAALHRRSAGPQRCSAEPSARADRHHGCPLRGQLRAVLLSLLHDGSGGDGQPAQPCGDVCSGRRAALGMAGCGLGAARGPCFGRPGGVPGRRHGGGPSGHGPEAGPDQHPDRSRRGSERVQLPEAGGALGGERRATPIRTPTTSSRGRDRASCRQHGLRRTGNREANASNGGTGQRPDANAAPERQPRQMDRVRSRPRALGLAPDRRRRPARLRCRRTPAVSDPCRLVGAGPGRVRLPAVVSPPVLAGGVAGGHRRLRLRAVQRLVLPR